MRVSARRLCAGLLALLLLTLSGCRRNDFENVPNPIATITMSDGSELRFELHLEIAPITVANFTNLANKGFYDGLEFYCIVPGVLIEAGSPTNDGYGNAGWTIKGEFEENHVTNTLSHDRGVLSMARQADDYDSASCIFFIMQGVYIEYDGAYAAFGTAADAETLSAIDRIGATAVDGNYSPLIRRVIRRIRVNTHGYEIEGPTIPLEE